LLVGPAVGAQAPNPNPNPQPRTIALTLDEAVRRAIEHNPDLDLVRLDSVAQDAQGAEANAAYRPGLSAAFGRSRPGTAASNLLAGTGNVESTDLFSSTGVRQRLRWGAGTWSASWDAGRTATNSPFSTFQPNLQSGVQFAFSQPLLRDRVMDSAKLQYVI